MKTYAGLRQEIFRVLGRGNVIHHQPTIYNRIGQSGVHTFIGDVIDIVMDACHGEATCDFREAAKALYDYLGGEE